MAAAVHSHSPLKELKRLSLTPDVHRSVSPDNHFDPTGSRKLSSIVPLPGFDDMDHQPVLKFSPGAAANVARKRIPSKTSNSSIGSLGPSTDRNPPDATNANKSRERKGAIGMSLGGSRSASSTTGYQHAKGSYEQEVEFLNAAISGHGRVEMSPDLKKKPPVSKTNYESFSTLQDALDCMPAGAMAHAIYLPTNDNASPFMKVNKDVLGLVSSSGTSLVFVPSRNNPSAVVSQKNIGRLKFVKFSDRCNVPKSRQSSDF